MNRIRSSPNEIPVSSVVLDKLMLKVHTFGFTGVFLFISQTQLQQSEALTKEDLSSICRGKFGWEHV